MVAHCSEPPKPLAVVFERPGEPPVRLDAADGRQAVTHAVGLLITSRKLQPGDRLTVEAAG
jgi:hypothetical protein